MARRFLSVLLGVWLLLGQLPRELSAQENKIQLCGRELIREIIRICGQLNWNTRALSLEESQAGFRPRKEIVPSSINKDAETLNMMSEFSPDLPQDLKATSDLSLENFKKDIQRSQSEVEDNSPLELIDIGLDKHSRKKRSITSIIDQCCQEGCTTESLAPLC
ncbi:prorelaxin [Dasypus novemcinctus]|uniref:prorelaxin n=1 Tax=Dasypus novemcinctus TaxID=9361 RepID=UPI000328AB7D|nr:prorelaxin [Dasypus novemcinctus]